MNPHRVLGVTTDATPEEIKAAYRRAARQWHPDRNPSPESAEKFREATAAYIALTKPPAAPPPHTAASPRPQYRRGGFTPSEPPRNYAGAAAAGGMSGIGAAAAMGGQNDLDALRDALRVALDIPPHLDPLEVIGQGFKDLYFAALHRELEKIGLARPRRRRRSGFQKFLDFLSGG